MSDASGDHTQHKTRPEWAGDCALRLPCVQGDSHRLAVAVLDDAPPWVIDAVPSAHALLVTVDPLAAARSEIESVLAERAAPAGPRHETTPRAHVVPVCYSGPDLAEVSAELGLKPDDVIRRHAERVYTVECVGFSPGFGYLTGLDPSLFIARKSTPAPRVPAGSVAIAGPYTGIYPHPTPGGWWLIGRTAMSMFDTACTPPATLSTGDTVRFEPAGDEAYTALNNSSGGGT